MKLVVRRPSLYSLGYVLVALAQAVVEVLFLGCVSLGWTLAYTRSQTRRMFRRLKARQ